MMAAVFLMQPLGQFVAYLVGLCALVGISRNRHLSPDDTRFEHAAPVVDAVWRCVVGVGAFPALIAIAARLSIPETPRYNLWKGKDRLAYDDATKVYGRLRDSFSSTQASNLQDTGTQQKRSQGKHAGSDQVEDIDVVSPQKSDPDAEAATIGTNGMPTAGVTSDSMESAGGSGQNVRRRAKPEENKNQFSRAELYQYFIKDGNWRTLVGISLCWGLWDVAYYGLALNNPRTISKIWLSQPLSADIADLPMWNSDPSNPGASIYEALYVDAKRSLITISIGSIFGSLAILGTINWVRRDRWLVWTFMGLAWLFAIMAGTIYGTYQTKAYPATIVLYTLAEVLFNLGKPCLAFVLSYVLTRTQGQIR
jgi:PHS family inorganic phosphate transporter-like MFS transporter